eukprot:TRINITY_DN9785_c0_g1_i1.p1 TRINITY_DN9785_c0_g1~~TRINITY_DN9785_c0_g1_i1.p1  ORF type:complete len:254 (-),score=47.26 TRINITY_DN9785_c0_g1_i1:181-891(-)
MADTQPRDDPFEFGCNGDIDFTDLEVIVEDVTFKESSAVMALSSPVFSAMLRSSMREGKMKIIRLEQKAAEEYAMFREYFKPRAINAHVMTIEDVDKLLPWFHEYQMSFMLHECEELLLREEATVKRMHQAYKYGLKRQYERCTEAVAMNFAHMNLEDLPRDTEIMFALLAAIQKTNANKDNELKSFKSKADVAIKRAANELYQKLPKEFKGNNGATLTDADCSSIVNGISSSLGI